MKSCFNILNWFFNKIEYSSQVFKLAGFLDYIQAVINILEV